MEREMDAEMEFHVAACVDDLVRRGIPPEQASRIARADFGSVCVAQEECREAVGLRILDELRQDFSYARRMLLRSPAFAALTILTLAVGIGLNSACFTIVNAWVLKPLPYPHAERLVAIWAADPKHSGPISVSAADLYDWRQSKPLYSKLFAAGLCRCSRSPATTSLYSSTESG
jgi:hypothetical protein